MTTDSEELRDQFDLANRIFEIMAKPSHQDRKKAEENLLDAGHIIQAYIAKKVKVAVEQNTIQLLKDFQPGKDSDLEHLAIIMQEEIMRANDRLANLTSGQNDES